MRISVKQGNAFLEDQTFAAARDSYESQAGRLYIMAMVETILHNPFPVMECPGNNTYAINTEHDCVFYKDDRFELIVDARGFKSKHINCKINKKKVTILGINRFKTIFTPWVTANKRRLQRSYRLPKNVDPFRSTCALSSEGILVVTAPWDREKFYEDELFFQAKQSLQESIGAKRRLEMISNIIQNPIPCSQLANNDGLKIETAMDCVFFHGDRFELIIDARGFAPENVKCSVESAKVKVSAHNNCALIAPTNPADKSKRDMKRLYQLPKDVNPLQSTCCLSSDGILVITAPWM